MTHVYYLLLIPLAALILGWLAWRGTSVDRTPERREVVRCVACGAEASFHGCPNCGKGER